MKKIFLYAADSQSAMKSFRNHTLGKSHTPISAEYAFTKHGAKVYEIAYRLKKK